MELALHSIVKSCCRDILLLIQSRNLASGEIATQFPVTRPVISQHLAMLIAAGLVAVRRQDTHRLYRARPEGLAEVRVFLERFWDERLQVLTQEAEADERRITTN